MLSKLRHRLTNRADSEHEQALIRLLIGSVVLIYCFSPLAYSNATHPGATAKVQVLISLFVVFSLVNIAAIMVWPAISPVRRIIGMVADLGATSYIMALTGYDGLPLFPIYLWVTMGNGFRYGRAYLLTSTAISLVGFGVVITVHPYWHQNYGLAASILIGLTVLPAYFGKLLRQLYNAIDRANEASAAKTRFLANMSHELRTPLNGVIGMTDLLIDTHLDAEQKQIAGAVQASAHALLDLVEDVLDISKIEAGKIVLDNTDFDLHRLLKDTVYLFRHQSVRKGITTGSHISSSVPFQLHGDCTRLRQVLVNLIGNAVKFTDTGRVDVYLGVVEQTRTTVRLRFEVVDTGIGIPESVQSKIFETFTQADETTTRRYGGSGLGTTIARQLVELMGGEIGLLSKPNVGTTFWFEIPFKRCEDPQLENDAVVSLDGLQVLYVGHDSAPLRALASGWRVQVHEVDGGLRGVAALLDGTQEERQYRIAFVNVDELGVGLQEFAAAALDEPTLSDVTLVPICGTGRDSVAALLQQFSTVLSLPLNKTEVFNALHAANTEQAAYSNVISLADRHRHKKTRANGHILVAEDNQINQQVIAGILKRSGHRCTIVDDGERALDALRDSAQQFDLMILDMHMPGLGGLDVFKMSRFMDTRRPIPTIILSADATYEAVAACKEAGAEAYFTKPVDSRKLLDEVARLLASEPGASAQTVLEAERIAPASLELISSPVIKRLRELSPETKFVEELVDEFGRAGEHLLQEIQAAIDGADYPRLRHALHALRGSSAELGCQRLAALCKQGYEVKPPAVSSAQSAEMVAELERVFSDTCNALQAETKLLATANP